MKFKYTCLAMLAAAGLTISGCGDMDEPTVTETAPVQPREEVQYGTPETTEQTRFESDLEKRDGETEFVTPEGREVEVEYDDGKVEDIDVER